MLPKWHILYGALISIIVYFVFNITIFQASLILLSSVLIDVDHYIWYVNRKKDLNLKNAYIHLKDYFSPTFMIFHNIEFLILILFLILVWKDFYFVLIGIIIHYLLDAFQEMCHNGVREWSIIRYLISDKGKYF